MALLQKILLCIITVAIALLLGAGLYSLSMEPSFRNDIWILVPAVLCILSVLSFIFHLKTISFYRDNSDIVKSFKSNAIIWYINVAFGGCLIILAFVFAFQFSKLYDNNIQTEFTLLAIIVIATLLIGLWVCLDFYTLYKKINEVKSTKYINQIDDISGQNNK